MMILDIAPSWIPSGKTSPWRSADVKRALLGPSTCFRLLFLAIAMHYCGWRSQMSRKYS